MKYLVNRETKEHIRYYEGSSVPLVGWDVVEADAEGWIPILCGGTECPLPASAHLDVRYRTGQKVENTWPADLVRWNDVRAYRPILDKPEDSRPTAEIYLAAADSVLSVKRDQIYAAEGVRAKGITDIISRLKSAHEAAQMIPDLLAELRQVLEPMGYDVVARSPFVESEPDMSDWRNWREGDLITVETHPCYDWWTPLQTYDIRRNEANELIIVSDDGDEYPIEGDRIDGHFRFHSRPERT